MNNITGVVDVFATPNEKIDRKFDGKFIFDYKNPIDFLFDEENMFKPVLSRIDFQGDWDMVVPIATDDMFTPIRNSSNVEGDWILYRFYTTFIGRYSIRYFYIKRNNAAYHQILANDVEVANIDAYNAQALNNQYEDVNFIVNSQGWQYIKIRANGSAPGSVNNYVYFHGMTIERNP